MFERRLKILLILLAIPTIGVAMRLVQLQVLRGGYYRDASERIAYRTPRLFPCLRGQIQDHEGRPLAFDAPAWDICVRYEVIAGEKRYLRLLTKTLPPDSPPIETQMRAALQAISDLTGTSINELLARQERILRRVGQIKEEQSNAQGIEVVVREERMLHPLVHGLDQNQQAAARVALAPYPWVEVVGSHRRQYVGDASLGHLLGFLNEVNEDDVRRDPNADDELAKYMGGDMHGAAGVELMAEKWLRGRRGLQEEDLEGRPVRTVDPVNGLDYRLTIDLPLQQLVYQKLAAAVADIPASTGGSAVVLDVPSRQVLALVSCPGFDANFSAAQRRLLDADAMRRPTRFRAVSEVYPPGSMVKPVVLAGAWTDGRVNADTRVTCTGQLSSTPPHFRCTGSHGSVDPVFAIQHSCNTFFYRVGEQLGVARLSYWLGLAGLGRSTGSGLVEEAPGFLPKEGKYRGESRYTAIGQWQVVSTPLQAANMIATVASGAWRPVTLWADDPDARPAAVLPVSPEAWRAVREGMYKVVNEPHGTAYDHIHLQNAGDLVLLGKTGSAETQVGAVVERIFVCKLPDGGQDEFVAANDTDLLLKHPELSKADILERRAFRYWPTEEMDRTHAWFAGYLTGKDRYLESSSGGRLNVALAVLIEFGGHGGVAAAPVAGEIVQAMIDMQERAGGDGREAGGGPHATSSEGSP